MKAYGKSKFHRWCHSRKNHRRIKAKKLWDDLGESDISKSAARHEAREEIEEEAALYLNNRQGDEDQMCNCAECLFWWEQRLDTLPVECVRVLEELSELNAEFNRLGVIRRGGYSLSRPLEPMSALRDIPTRTPSKEEGVAIQKKIDACGKFVELSIEELVS